MSAPVSRDPLVVNTQDGSCWTRRAVTREGRGLYALAGSVAGVPDVVLASLADLAEHGLASMADALPMPVGPEPQESSVDADRAKAPWGRGENGRPLLPMGAHWTDIPELVDGELANIRTRVDQAQAGSWYVASTIETWRAPGTVCTRVDGYHRTVGQFTNLSATDLELVLHAHSDLAWCLDMVAKLRARVAELEAERHSTNEALSDAAVALRAYEQSALPSSEVSAAERRTWVLAARLGGGVPKPRPEAATEEDVSPQVQKLRDLLAGQRAVVEDPHDGPLHHSYRVGRDLPETGGVS